MENLPNVNLGIVAVSRDCFPIELSEKRRKNVVKACGEKKVPVTEINKIVENENDIPAALLELEKNKVNALVVYLGNFGPEGPLSKLAQKFNGPVMFVAAAEETGENLYGGRGDAFCGLLSASYNAGLRSIKPYMPEYPVGRPEEIAEMIGEFIPVARIILGIRKLKIFTFGPRPFDFNTLYAPVKPLMDIGVEVMENSELDLYELFNKAKNNPEVPGVLKDMEKELGSANKYPGILPKLAQYEVALTSFFKENLGTSEYGVFANKCWPAFQTSFGFVPCYVNSRLAARGIPVACEADIYGALSEYMLTCATGFPATILDVNNTVPLDMYEKAKNTIGDYAHNDLFMGFHCGNTCSSCMANYEMKYQLIMHRLLEPDKEPDITRGTIEGTIGAGNMTLFRFQGTPENDLKVYVAEGEVLDMDPKTFGSTGIIAIKEMGRFYRHVLLEKKFPHHAGVGFKHAGKALYSASRLLGVDDVSFNLPKGMYYPTENPFQ
ncbi:hypothetical protein ES708_17795 [subsurface metagenome]